MTKAELQKHGEKLGDELFFEHHGCLTGDCPHMTQRECSIHAFTEGVTAILELLFPLVDALKNSAAPWDLNEKTKVIEVLTECSIRENGCKKALAELEKKVRGE
jgi:hypothetical protein